MSDSFDTPSTEELYQAGSPYPDKVDPIDVKVCEPVQVDELPTNTVYRNVIALTGSNAVKILNADPRRKNFLIWVMELGSGFDALCIGSKEGDVTNFVGSMIMSVNAITRYEFTDRGEVWMRPCVINATGGTFTGYTVSTDDAVVSLVIEQWAN